MKKIKEIKRLNFFILFLICSLSSPVFAHAEDPMMFTTDSAGSHTPKFTFGWDEQPWFYFSLPNGYEPLELTTEWYWLQEPQQKFYSYSEGAASYETWLSLDGNGQNDDWFLERQLGEWSIATSGTTEWGGEPIYYNNVNFTVTPEPISMLLFLTGGSILAISNYRKKRLA